MPQVMAGLAGMTTGLGCKRANALTTPKIFDDRKAKSGIAMRDQALDVDVR